MATLSRDGVLVVKREVPLATARECLVSRHALDGFLTALHITLDHPSSYQLNSDVQRYFYALDLDKAIGNTMQGCRQCSSLKKFPHVSSEQSTSDQRECVGYLYAADVFRRERQYILAIREYTVAALVENELRETLTDAILQWCLCLCPLEGPPVVIWTDSAPGFAANVNDELLSHHHITLELGRTKNVNKGPVAERAIQELEEEILRLDLLCHAVSPVILSIAVARLNARLRSRGLSVKEMWTHRDQFSHK